MNPRKVVDEVKRHLENGAGIVVNNSELRHHVYGVFREFSVHCCESRYEGTKYK